MCSRRTASRQSYPISYQRSDGIKPVEHHTAYDAEKQASLDKGRAIVSIPEVGIGPDAEVFMKRKSLRSVGVRQ